MLYRPRRYAEGGQIYRFDGRVTAQATRRATARSEPLGLSSMHRAGSLIGADHSLQV